MSEPSATRTLTVGLIVAGGLVCAAGLAVELARYGGCLDSESWLRTALSLSFEGNLPTWYSAGLLWTAALGLAICAWIQADRDRVHWWVLSAIFMLMSLDEAIELHEHLGGLPLHGPLYFSWVVPGAVLTSIVGVAYLGFLGRLPRATRLGFIASFCIYVGAALGMELPLGAWFEAHGDENLVYAALDFTEECLEIVGSSVFLVVIARHIQAASSAPQS